MVVVVVVMTTLSTSAVWRIARVPGVLVLVVSTAHAASAHIVVFSRLRSTPTTSLPRRCRRLAAASSVTTTTATFLVVAFVATIRILLRAYCALSAFRACRSSLCLGGRVINKAFFLEPKGPYFCRRGRRAIYISIASIGRQDRLISPRLPTRV